MTSIERARFMRDRVAGNPRRLAAVTALVLASVAFGAMAPWVGVLVVVGALLWTLVPLSERPPEPVRNGLDSGAVSDVAGAMLEAVPAPLIALDRAGRVTHANRRAREFFAITATGQHISQLRRTPDLLAATETVLAAGGAQSVDLIERVPVERRMRATLTAIASTHDEAAGVPSVLLFVEDLTEQAQLAEMRADFVANASHELRTPLTSLKGFVETLKGAAKDDPKARDRFLEIMHEQAGRMTRLIDDLLSLSRVEMREHVPPKDTIELSGLVRHVAEMMAPLAASSGVEIRLEPLAAPLAVRGDRDEIIQVVQNLVENAIKYRRAEGPRVTVSVVREPAQASGEGQIVLRVSDNGPGIAPEHLPRLTERFYRVSARQSREKGGTGLGLAIVKHIINRHGGELSVQSRVGEGSTFTVLLPASR